jgi:hypothetical protein
MSFLHSIYLKFDNIVSCCIPHGLFEGYDKMQAELVLNYEFRKFSYRNLIQKNSKLKNLGKGKEAFLLATGPSIKNENLKVLAGEDCFSVSNFFLHEDINIIKPKYHFFAPYHLPLVFENYIEWLRQADLQLPEKTEIVLGHRSIDHVKKYRLFPKRKIHYMYLRGRVNVSADITGPIQSPRTGPLMIIPFLLYMGYKRIYLLGCDNNTLLNYKSKIHHFYENEKDPRANASDEQAWTPDILQAMQSQIGMFEQYKSYVELAKKTSQEIINLSQESWLDFIRKDELKYVL